MFVAANSGKGCSHLKKSIDFQTLKKVLKSQPIIQCTVSVLWHSDNFHSLLGWVHRVIVSKEDNSMVRRKWTELHTQASGLSKDGPKCVVDLPF